MSSKEYISEEGLEKLKKQWGIENVNKALELLEKNDLMNFTKLILVNYYCC